MKETDLYLPVKNLFENFGYKVNSEVADADIVAIKDDDLIIIELKTTYSLKLIIQGIKRQRIANKVYVAIPIPKFKKKFSKDFKDKEYLLRRLELGLIFVTLNTKNPYAQIVFDPKPFNKKLSQAKSTYKREITLREISNRNGDYNLGGTRGKLITAYKEKAILIAYHLEKNGEMSVKELREAGGGEKTQRILSKNYYGWYERKSRGIYSLSSKGKKELSQYKYIIEQGK